MRRSKSRAALIALCVFGLALASGCTFTGVTLPNGIEIESWGAPLVNRHSGLEVSGSFPDEGGVLYPFFVKYNAKEDTSPQADVLTSAIDAFVKGYMAGQGPVPLPTPVKVTPPAPVQ